MTTRTPLLCFTLFCANLLTAQSEPKVYSIERCSTPPVIDGKSNDEVWNDAAIATNFFMLEPENGTPERNERRTEVQLAFDDDAIYVFARMHDESPEQILHQYSPRDVYNVNTDYFGIFINPFNDGLSDFNFYVTAAGVQSDSRTTDDGEDISWNTVWKSEVSIDSLGWTVEMEIPYQCLRFSEKAVKDWGLNMMRYTRRNRQNYTWNFIDRSVATYELQTGLLRGMENIKPPVRLSLMPYFSAYENVYPSGDHAESVNFGADLKYGINESFTLDATLIPDFGQVAFDKQVLNLGPFENQYQENRQFFVEGTDLFSKGNMFYSRRIGGSPKNITNADLSDLSDLTQDYTRLLNATKISGRTSGNTGIGFLNAITDNNYIEGTDSTGEELRILTEPLTNYNVFVIDQRINRNRSVSLVNTNVMRNGAARDANVTGFIANLNNNSNSYKLYGEGKYAHIAQGDSTIGDYSTYVALSKIKGNWRWNIAQQYVGDEFDQNDLGFQARNNRFGHSVEGSYQIFQPTGWFNRYRITAIATHYMLANPRVYESFDVEGHFFGITKRFFAFGLDFESSPVDKIDYFEARVPDRKFIRPPGYTHSGWISTDYRRPFAIDASFTYYRQPGFDNEMYSFNIEPIVRVNDKLNFSYEITPSFESNNTGWSGFMGDSVIIGARGIWTAQQNLKLNYIFTPKMSLSLNFRHYWRSLRYNQYYNLEEDGTIEVIAEDLGNDVNFNTVNVDLKFSWWYAPGSELVLLYRSSLIDSDNNVNSSYGENFIQSIGMPSTHIFSIRLTYFLDYAIFAS
ncbi:DUF5916 domain-containing protein [Phaeocystidibacter marisrubri]|uniref:Carbohydrate binding family 9 domain-containing protein n=1 Tax=Phaeocystidibacter marisrubri TaxID=1577780 RepID=A0A6L3ZJW4_9FLAO|nr:DUF5916 domain-containing protein [Phaeocystidibacter marisrubri]KAB2817705.1 carbohydrate binding family 9 domain-containing protein [Phaeocystidibacter marisrubri]